MATINVSGTSVNYTASGEGQGLVLLHGTSVDAQANFGHVVEGFADRRRIIRPNYGGAGGSTIPGGDLTLDIIVEQIAATIRHAANGPIDLLGDSLGAVVAAATAARHPSLVRRLVLAAGWAWSGDARHQMVFDTWARLAALGSDLGNCYVMSLAVSPQFLSALGPDSLSSFLRQAPAPDTLRRIDLGRRIDIREAARTIAAPTLIIAGAQDYLVPPYQTLDLHRRIGGSRCVELECGHALFLEKADELVGLIRTFLFDE
jgi:pimeloyl-ACP methyl ester carboxylesterase